MTAGADRLRPEWPSLPAGLRAQVEAQLGGDRTSDSPAQGGFSAGYAGVVRSAERAVFVKAIAAEGHTDSRTFLRREIRMLRAAPSGVTPRLLSVIDDADGTALILEIVPGIHPGTPWTDGQLHAVAAEIARLAAATAAAPIPAARESMLPSYARWGRIAEDHALAAALPLRLQDRMPQLLQLEASLPDALTGTALAHGDLRADNILIHGERARFIDWPHARRGVPWLDGPLLVPSIEASGGPTCAESWRALREHGAPDAARLLPVIAGFASFLWWNQAQPEIAELPGLRAFQRAQADPILRWLGELL
ncbi:aminoglycoside phosphotransferase family protein [Microbacterium bovistercoris]|uniref:Aminoglycoside phosphotransferase family protein n=1 Tax=Microbacterium bovistercoris TaxID=2293570 RepID=A0A371NT49_9MICO|nr:phosphotransferase [Microbacterium bovistercoris]REJ05442.1 aminoglycoside phosphotransferase family protein [Microbacterium bovistercoris]